MRISDWSSGVCSSDLFGERLANRALVVDEQQVRDFDHDRFAWHSAPSKGRCRTGVEEYPPGDRRAGYSPAGLGAVWRSEEHTSELQSLMRISYAVFCLKKKKTHNTQI